MNINCDAIIKQVVSEMKERGIGTKEVQKEASEAKAAVLTKMQNYEVKTFPIPDLGKQDVLVRVEGSPVVEADMTEYLKEYKHSSTVLGKEGTGTIVRMGSEGLKDIAGKSLAIGDRVTSVFNYAGSADYSFRTNWKKEGSVSGYGLLPDSKGWFAEYIVVKGGTGLFRVNNLDVESALLVEPVMKIVRLVGRAIEMKKLHTESKVVVQECGLNGLLCIAALRSIGVSKIVAISKDKSNMELAKSFGAMDVIDSHMCNGAAGIAERIKKDFQGSLADVAFQCADDRLGRATIACFVKEAGIICEIQSKKGKEEFVRSSQFDLGGRDLVVLGYWNPTAPDYTNCLEFFKTAKEMNIPIYKLITHRYRLDQINEAHWAAIRGAGLRIAIVKR